MPGFLGASSGGGGGTGGEIFFPKEFIDPVTKFRVSQPENLIDTDFEYGLQPTKWETVELINNTPSFFSKSGDTTIDGIVSMVTNAGTREITVETALDHNLAVGIPINVTGTKSLTADGSFIIASIPNSTTFTYLCKSNQNETVSINDLYTSIITGEFFQGSQIGISDSEGILTDGQSVSTLTVKTRSTHGFGEKTPLYFLNINSTISQDFQAANTATRSFDASNSATAQSFDGSNTFSTLNIDWSNSGVESSKTSTVSSVSTTENTITVSHAEENFSGLEIGTPLYYDVQSGAGFFNQNPRGVVFLKTNDSLGEASSTFQVSELPGDENPAISIESAISGTFQVSDLSKTFAGNNVDPQNEVELTVVRGTEYLFDGANQGYTGDVAENNTSTVVGYTGDSITITGDASLDYYEGAMILYSSTGSAASGLTNNTTYFVKTFSSTGTPGVFSMTISDLPGESEPVISGISGGTGTQTFAKIGVSIDKDIVHVKNSNFEKDDMLEYSFPAGGQISTNDEKNFYFVEEAYDAHNYQLNSAVFIPTSASGGTFTIDELKGGRLYKTHFFTSPGSFTFSVESVGSSSEVEVYVIGGGGGGGNTQAATSGGGGGGGGLAFGVVNVSATDYAVTVGAGGVGNNNANGGNGGSSSFGGILSATGGSGNSGRTGGAGGTGSGGSVNGTGGSGSNSAANNSSTGGSGTNGGAGGGGAGSDNARGGFGGNGNAAYYTGGGGAGGGDVRGETAGPNSGGSGYFSGGRGASDIGTDLVATAGEGPSGGSPGQQGSSRRNNGGGGGSYGGGGGGGADWQNSGSTKAGGGSGGGGAVIVSYPISPISGEFISATGGDVSLVDIGGDLYAIHAFTNTGSSTFAVNSLADDANKNSLEVLIVAGGGGGFNNPDSGGGGAGGLIYETITPSAQSYTINVGQGGGQNSNGSNSSAFGLTALGGGRGGNRTTNNAAAGGSGGGGGYDEPGKAGLQPTSSSGGFGNAGGDGSRFGFRPSGEAAEGGGGGGAGGVGERGGSRPGVGGAGRFYGNEFTTSYGDNGWFASGGSGGGERANSLPSRGPGGGASYNVNSIPNTGGGGAATDDDAPIASVRNGASGVVLIKYLIRTAN